MDKFKDLIQKQKIAISLLDKIRADAVKLNVERRTRSTFEKVWTQTQEVVYQLLVIIKN